MLHLSRGYFKDLHIHSLALYEVGRYYINTKSHIPEQNPLIVPLMPYSGWCRNKKTDHINEKSDLIIIRIYPQNASRDELHFLVSQLMGKAVVSLLLLPLPTQTPLLESQYRQIYKQPGILDSFSLKILIIPAQRRHLDEEIFWLS